MKNKTPEYTRQAIRNYEAKFDKISVNLPKGTKDKIKELTGLSVGAYINKLIQDDLSKYN